MEKVTYNTIVLLIVMVVGIYKGTKGLSNFINRKKQEDEKLNQISNKSDDGKNN